jgi:hypothetical protein
MTLTETRPLTFEEYDAYREEEGLPRLAYVLNRHEYEVLAGLGAQPVEEWQSFHVISEVDRVQPPPPQDKGDPMVPDERFKLWTPEDLIANNVPPVWTVKGLVIHPTYGFLAGAEKSLKSYLAQIIAVGVAAGAPVLGQFAVPKAVPVLMMCGEGGQIPYTRRLLRIADAYGVNLADLPLFSTTDVASVMSDVFRTSFARNLKEVGPGLTVIEPFYAFHGSASEGKMLAVEGDMLTWMSHTALEHGSSLIVGNHYNQTGTGSGLRRITGVGPAEWSDSWWIVEKDDGRSDVATGHFELALEVGSRQWGGTSWDVVIDIGPFNDDTMDNEGDITWTVQRSTGKQAGSGGSTTRILSIVTAHPFEYSKAQIVAQCSGKKNAAEAVFTSMMFKGQIEKQKLPRLEGNRMVKRDLWGPPASLITCPQAVNSPKSD